MIEKSDEQISLIKLLYRTDMLKYFEDSLMDMSARKGVLGEKHTKFTLLLSLVAGTLGYPTINMLKGDSSTGKTNLANAITGLFNTSKVGELSPTALKYIEDYDFDVLYIQEITEAESNSKGLRLMSGDDGGFIAQTTVSKKSKDGFTTQKSVIPVKTLVLLTTGVEMNSELMNRSFIIPLDDSKKQTENVLKFYSRGSNRELNEFLGKNKYGEKYGMFKAVLKLLKPHKVFIPFEKEVMHIFPANKTRSRRDAQKFLDLIRGSCLLFQYQRPRLIINGKIRLLAVWQDLKNVMEVFYPILDSTMSGADNRYNKILQIMPGVYKNHGYVTTELLISKGVGYGASTVRKILNEFAERGILFEDPKLKFEKCIGGNTKVYRYDINSEQNMAFSRNAELNWFKVLKNQREWLNSERYVEKNCIKLVGYTENVYYDPVTNLWKKFEGIESPSQKLQLCNLESWEEKAIKNRKIEYNSALEEMAIITSISKKVTNYDTLYPTQKLPNYEVDNEIINTINNSKKEIKLETVVDIVEAILDVSKKQVKGRIALLVHKGFIIVIEKLFTKIKDSDGPSKPNTQPWKYLKLNHRISLEDVLSYPFNLHNYQSLIGEYI